MIKAAARAVGQTVDDVAKAISKTTAKVIGSDSDTLVVRTGQALKASHVLQFANQTSQGVVNVMIADMYVKAAKVMKELETGLVDSKIFRGLIQKILEYFMQTNNLVADLFREMTNVQESQHDAARFVTSRIGSAAA